MSEVKRDDSASRDRVRDSVVRMIQYMRANHTQNMELEIRVGKFSTDNCFHPGFSADHRILINRMGNRMHKNTIHPEMKHLWSSTPQSLVMRCEYEKGVRKTVKPNHEEEIIVKQRIGKIDITTDREYHLRFSLSRETKINLTPKHHLFNTVNQGPPLSVRYLMRSTFTEKIPSVTKDPEDDFCLQWDISKVSERAATKEKSTKSPCTFHCEIELKSQLKPLADKAKEEQQDQLLADLLLARARAVLGTSYIQGDSLRPLPPAKLMILTKDV